MAYNIWELKASFTEILNSKTFYIHKLTETLKLLILALPSKLVSLKQK